MKPYPFPLVGGAYNAADPDQDAQELINWYVEVSKSETSKEAKALLGVPGKVSVASPTTGEVRGAWALPGGSICLWVIGSKLYRMAVSSGATTTTPATFSMTLVGTLGTSTGQVSIRDNGIVAVIVDGPFGYVYNISNGALTNISDPAFYGANRVAFIDGWFIFNKPGTQIFYTSPLYWNGVDLFDGSYFALKDSSSDNLVSLIESLRELWLIGERTTELWYDAGNTYFPFSRLQGISLQIGCAAPQSVTRFRNGLAWLAKSERGENVVVATQGYDHSVISSPAVSKEIAKYPVVSDAFAFTYNEDGHSFYVLTFPTADVTWVYDAQSDEWHKRASYDGVNLHRDRANCFINFQDQRLVGDYLNGNVYRLSRQVYTDGTGALISLRRSPHIWDGGARERVFHSQLQVQFRAGVGLSNGQGSSPQVMLRWSDDSGFTWSNQYTGTSGAIGQTKTRLIWRRLGASRDRIYELSISDPVNRDVVGASLWIDNA